MAYFNENSGLDIEQLNRLSFEEYVSFHKSVVKKAEQIAQHNRLRESVKNDISDEEFMESHGLIELDKFLKNMNDKYGI